MFLSGRAIEVAGQGATFGSRGGKYAGGTHLLLENRPHSPMLVRPQVQACSWQYVRVPSDCENARDVTKTFRESKP